jgi:CBS domain-containing protein
MKISELMHKGVEAVSPDTSIAVVAKTMRDKDIGAIPVTQDGQLVGMITDRDLAVRALANGQDLTQLTARNVMTTGVVSCRDSDDADHAVQLMESKHIRRLPVIDQNRRMVGIVSVGDLCHALPADISAEVLRSVSAHHA